MERLVTGYSPGAIGRIVEMHGTYYHRHWKFGLFFEAKVASELSEFTNRFEEGRDGIWTILNGEQIAGSIAIDRMKAGGSEGAHLRWFIIDPQLQGQGWGKHLLTKAVSFCDQREYRRIYLWTFKGLASARHLYETVGFQLVSEQDGDKWGTRVNEQLFERK